MSYMKVSIWCFMVLLMTMSVASVAMGEGNLIVSIDIDQSNVFVGDLMSGRWFVVNQGSSVATNLMADVTCPLLDPLEDTIVIGDLNPGESFRSPILVRAIQTGASHCTLHVSGTGNSASIGSQVYSIIERPESVPEFPTVALPVIAVIGMMFLFQRRKGK